ncbi:MAG TPA: hypothetical protein VGP87_00485 [Gemmatimonadales bacterium]|jgi:hypothetical protein|nr:hypothetical protein [Gemmatimonadales bacterium]
MDIEGVLAITFIFGGGTLFLLAISPVGKALADRIRHGAQPLGAGGTEPEVLNELEQLRHDVGELQERVDFTERLLSQKQAAGEFKEGGHAS